VRYGGSVAAGRRPACCWILSLQFVQRFHREKDPISRGVERVPHSVATTTSIGMAMLKSRAVVAKGSLDSSRADAA